MSDNTFQVYKNAAKTTKMITDKGKTLVFTNYTCITDDSQVIDYLDACIKEGQVGITKDDPIKSEELDPMASLRKRIIAEHEAEKAKEIVVPKDFSELEGLPKPKLNPTSSTEAPGATAVSVASVGTSKVSLAELAAKASKSK